ncbi:hypothetical protein HGRIS_004051 [Hohenbuehelia grisea]|uniref:Uncharacterized protein n=1 Tax=Hohenbuehelia grisea TaxID=104357 RepID=A0ABR3JHI4_9AGAR
MSSSKLLHLIPPLVENGRVEEFISSGQTVSMSQSPCQNSLAVFVNAATVSIWLCAELDAVQDDTRSGKDAPQDQPIYFVSRDTPPASERRLFITDTLIIFTALQNLARESVTLSSEWQVSVPLCIRWNKTDVQQGTVRRTPACHSEAGY